MRLKKQFDLLYSIIMKGLRSFKKLLKFFPPGLKTAIKKLLLPENLPEGEISITQAESWLECKMSQTQFRLPLDCRYDFEWLIKSAEDAFEFKTFHQIAQRKKLFFDIGAHCGIFSALFGRLNFPDGKFVSFEPSQTLAAKLKQTVSLNTLQNVAQIEQIAIGDHCGQMTMLLDPAGGFVQSQHFAHTMWEKPHDISIPMETIDAFCEKTKLFPDLIKMDIEGFEHEAIIGGKNVLSGYKPDLFLEFHLDFLEQRKIPPQKSIELLLSYGYQLFDLKLRKLTLSEICSSLQPRIHIIARK